MKEILLLWILGLCNCAYGSRILVIPIQGKSHMISTNAIGQELKNNGHEVYTLAEPQYKGQDKKIGATGLNILYYQIPEGTKYIDSEEGQKILVERILSETMSISSVTSVIYESCNGMMSDKDFLKTVESLNFDLAVVEGIPLLPCAYLLPHVFKIPHITFSLGYFSAAIPGSVDLPSYFPSLLVSPESLPMTFKERLINTLMYILMSKKVAPYMFALTGFIPQWNNVTLIEQYREKGMVSDDIRGWLDFYDETQLVVLANADLTFDYPKPLFPNVVSVEGISVKEAKPLSEEMETLVQSSENGVIVVSFGSNVQYLPDEYIIKMVNAFRKRKELFLMRYSGSLSEQNFDVPPNVKFMSWLPQNDLLAHNKTKLFITHGGINGLHEAIYQGVPMLCVPLFGDQPANAKKLVAKGFGLSFRLVAFTEDEVVQKIEEIVSNPSYREKAQLAGQIMRHRPMGAKETAAFWIEHVLKFGGEHLRPSSMDLTWWQFYCLDTIGFMALTTAVIMWILFKAFKFLLKLTLRILAGNHAKTE